MLQKNIVIAPCGNRSFVFKESWLKEINLKEFDLCLLFYDEIINEPERYNAADFLFHLKDFKYHMIYKLFLDIKKEWLDEYDYFYFLDDDIEIDTRSINRLFALSKAFESQISCAALSADSFCSWPIFKQKSGHFCRYVGQVEVMAPLFSAPALKICLPSFTATKSSWGLDSVWAKLLDYPEHSLIVFDTVIMKHLYPVGKGDLYRKLGVNPEEEWMNIINLYGARRHNLQEFNKIYCVDRNSNNLVNSYFKYRDKWTSKKLLWRKKIASLIPKKTVTSSK